MAFVWCKVDYVVSGVIGFVARWIFVTDSFRTSSRWIMIWAEPNWIERWMGAMLVKIDWYNTFRLTIRIIFFFFLDKNEMFVMLSSQFFSNVFLDEKKNQQTIFSIDRKTIKSERTKHRKRKSVVTMKTIYWGWADYVRIYRWMNGRIAVNDHFWINSWCVRWMELTHYSNHLFEMSK